MPANLIDRTQSAYPYPLLIKQLLHTPLAVYPEQEIVYRNQKRYDYWTLRHRIGQLASGLNALGIEHGDTVAMMDWDSHRYLESYFAVPMMGAVLMTVNVRLAPEQIAYTLNHSGASALLINAEFLPVLEQIKDRLERVDRFVLIDDTGEIPVPFGFADTLCSLPARRISRLPTSTRTRAPRPSIRPGRPASRRGSISAIANLCCIP